MYYIKFVKKSDSSKIKYCNVINDLIFGIYHLLVESKHNAEMFETKEEASEFIKNFIAITDTPIRWDVVIEKDLDRVDEETQSYLNKILKGVV